MKKTLYLASKNSGKIFEYKKLLSRVNCNLLLQPESIDIIENGKNFRENAIKKASKVSLITKNYAIADDSGLCINALNGDPGIYSSRYASNDKQRIERVLRELSGFDDRSAFFVAHICLASPKGEILFNVEEKCYGNILQVQRGSNGFGYDPIFEEKFSGLTFAEMNDDVKSKESHRGKALNKIIPKLVTLFGDV